MSVHRPKRSLLEAMREAAPRDRIAYQYASDFDDVFVTGLSALAEAEDAGLRAPLRAVAVYLAFLGKFPDTHIFRKFGAEAAAAVQRWAQEMRASFHATRGDCLAELLAFDARLKARGFNPGTSADLTVATLFADRLRNGLPIAAMMIDCAPCGRLRRYLANRPVQVIGILQRHADD